MRRMLQGPLATFFSLRCCCGTSWESHPNTHMHTKTHTHTRCYTRCFKDIATAGTGSVDAEVVQLIYPFCAARIHWSKKRSWPPQCSYICRPVNRPYDQSLLTIAFPDKAYSLKFDHFVVGFFNSARKNRQHTKNRPCSLRAPRGLSTHRYHRWQFASQRKRPRLCIIDAPWPFKIEITRVDPSCEWYGKEMKFRWQQLEYMFGHTSWWCCSSLGIPWKFPPTQDAIVTTRIMSHF